MATITTELIDHGERRDLRGRLRVPAARRAELLADYERSGLSQAAFARREGLRYSTFAHWVQQAKPGQRRPRVRTSRPVSFREVALALPGSGLTLEVGLADGTTVRGNSTAEIVALVRALR